MKDRCIDYWTPERQSFSVNKVHFVWSLRGLWQCYSSLPVFSSESRAGLMLIPPPPHPHDSHESGNYSVCFGHGWTSTLCLVRCDSHESGTWLLCFSRGWTSSVRSGVTAMRVVHDCVSAVAGQAVFGQVWQPWEWYMIVFQPWLDKHTVFGQVWQPWEWYMIVVFQPWLDKHTVFGQVWQPSEWYMIVVCVSAMAGQQTHGVWPGGEGHGGGAEHQQRQGAPQDRQAVWRHSHHQYHRQMIDDSTKTLEDGSTFHVLASSTPLLPQWRCVICLDSQQNLGDLTIMENIVELANTSM